MAELEFYQITCSGCGVLYMVTKSFDDHCRKTHKTFYCPGCGHSYWYTQDNAEEKLRKQVESLKETAQRESDRRSTIYEALEHEIRVRTGHQGTVAKLKKQLALGAHN